MTILVPLKLTMHTYHEGDDFAADSDVCWHAGEPLRNVVA